ncbi:MAG: phosphotransferase [Pseudomonadota bacterium]
MVTIPRADKVLRALEAFLRRATGREGLRVAFGLERITGGFDTAIYGFRLEGAPDALSGALVLRLFRDAGQGRRARGEAAVHDVLASNGFPTPGMLVDTVGATILDRPFLIMKRLRGRPLLAVFSADPAGTAETAGALLGETQARLHGLPMPAMEQAFIEAGVDMAACTPFQLLADIDRLARATGDDMLTALGGWLEVRRPRPPSVSALCHGDFHPGNIMVHGMSISGVIDWANFVFGHPEYDIAATRFVLSTAAIESGSDQEQLGITRQRFVAAYDAAYQKVRPIDEDLVRYYLVLRAGRALARVVASRYGNDIRGAAHDVYAWAQPAVYEAVRNLIRDETGLDSGPLVMPDRVG